MIALAAIKEYIPSFPSKDTTCDFFIDYSSSVTKPTILVVFTSPEHFVTLTVDNFLSIPEDNWNTYTKQEFQDAYVAGTILHFRERSLYSTLSKNVSPKEVRDTLYLRTGVNEEFSHNKLIKYYRQINILDNYKFLLSIFLQTIDQYVETVFDNIGSKPIYIKSIYSSTTHIDINLESNTGANEPHVICREAYLNLQWFLNIFIYNTTSSFPIVNKYHKLS